MITISLKRMDKHILLSGINATTCTQRRCICTLSCNRAYCMSQECLQPQTLGNLSINTGYYSAINIVLCSPAYVTHAVADFKNCATVDIYTLGEYIAAMEDHNGEHKPTYSSGFSRLEQCEAPPADISNVRWRAAESPKRVLKYHAPEENVLNVFHFTCRIFSKYGYTQESLPSSNSPFRTRHGTLILWSSSMTLQVFRLPMTVNSEGPVSHQEVAEWAVLRACHLMSYIRCHQPPRYAPLRIVSLFTRLMLG
jgi:hypothetical protein